MHKYICTIDLTTITEVEADNYDEALTEALYNVIEQMVISPDKFVNKTLKDAKCILLRR